AREVLEKAESTLRSLAGDAVKLGRYEEVQTLARWAKQISELRSVSGNLTVPDANDRQNGNARSAEPVAGYPRFLRHGESIVKVGWSKAKAERYEHRAPRDVLAAVLAALSRAGGRKRPIPVEALIQLRSRDNKPIPNYQVYVALSLLCSHGVLEQHGRRGYSISQDLRDPAALTAQVWDSLPHQEGAQR